jgi:hypothetical protein
MAAKSTNLNSDATLKKYYHYLYETIIYASDKQPFCNKVQLKNTTPDARYVISVATVEDMIFNNTLH